MSKYNKTTALVLCVLLGYLGIHHFYVNRNKMGILYLFTCGLFGFGWVIDILLIVINKFKDGDGNYLTSAKRSNVIPVQSQPAPAQPASANYPVTPNITNSSSFTDNNNTNDRPKIKIPSEIDGQTLAYKYTDVNVCVIRGEEPDYSVIIENFKNEQMIISLELESENPYDNKAVRVMYKDIKLGYLYRGTIKDMAYDYLSQNRPIFCYLSSIDVATNKMQLFISFYHNNSNSFEEVTSIYTQSVAFKLTSNKGTAMQEAISCSSVGDELDFSYDYDKEKYCFTDYDEIGYAPSSKNSLLEEIEDDCLATIKEIDTDDNDKYFVVVEIEYN